MNKVETTLRLDEQGLLHVLTTRRKSFRDLDSLKRDKPPLDKLLYGKMMSLIVACKSIFADVVYFLNVV